MSKSVIINLGSGDLYQGFPRVTVQLCTEDNPLPEQFVGTLPAAPALIELYRNWQLVYRGLCDRIPGGQRHDITTKNPALLLPKKAGQLEISEAGITNVSQVDFDELCQQIQTSINTWLKSEGFLPIEHQLRSRLNPSDLIRVIFETKDPWLRYLPWHRWNFFQDYPQAEMALSQPEYQRRTTLKTANSSTKVRILAVLGNSDGVDLEAETRLLQQLQDAEVKFLVNPSRQTFNDHLWQSEGWDILFFAGHSQTQEETGRIYINENPTNNSLTILQLEEALKAAIEKGLKLAIFNSCDGLGLAQALEQLHIPTVVVMREPVANCVAQAFFQQFLSAFARDRLPLYLAIQQARRKLQGLEDEFPAASWLPVICQNLAVEPPTWLQLGGLLPCPYRGLSAFREEDARCFFGREQLTQALLAAVKQKSLVAVIGASGSGKSSVVFAGLVPLLRQENSPPQIISFRPSNNPFEALAVGLAQCSAIALFLPVDLEQPLRQDARELSTLINHMGQQISGLRLILIADQFEELYTLCPEGDRQPFLDILLNAVKLSPAFTLILTLRADFCGYALAYRPFSDALQGTMQILGSMNAEELQTAIATPASHLQMQFETGLTQKLIHDVGEQPGRLPLLEFALTQLWTNQCEGWLTHQAYDKIGGVENALANHAERVYAQLNEADRRRAQQIFIQLVKPGVGTDDSRRLATQSEVKPENWDLVTHLASDRLVVTNRHEATNEETVEIIHEALIRSWKRLRDWMQCDGAFRLWQEHLRAAQRQWESCKADEGALLRGTLLVEADYWQQQRREELSVAEQTFIQRSLGERDRTLKQQKQRRQLTLAGLTGGLIGALLIAGAAWRQWQDSAHSEINAISASSEALFVSNNPLDALLEAIRAKQKLQKLGGTENQAQVDSVLRQATYGAVEYNRLSGHSDQLKSVVFSHDGSTIASTGDDKTIKLWKRDGTLLKTLTGHNGGIWAVVFSPDDRIIVSVSTDKSIKVWKRDGTLLKTLTGHSAAVRGVAFSPDGQIIASVSDDKTVKVWKRDGTLLKTLTGHTGVVDGVAFSPDGQIIASASDDKTVKLWKRDGALLKTLIGHTGVANGVAFSPDGQMLASTSWDKTIKLWKLSAEKEPTLLNTLQGHGSVVFSVAFSPNSQILASTSWDKTVKLWKRDGTLITTLNGHGDRVWGVAFSPDGNTLASASGDKQIKLWRLNSPLLTTLTGHHSAVIGIAFSPDSNTLASTSDDKTVKLWKRDGTLLMTITGYSAQVYGVAFSPNGQTLVSASADNAVKLWKLETDKTPVLLTTLRGHQAPVWEVAFSPDGQTLASASWDNTVKLWSASRGKIDVLHATLKGHQSSVMAVAFSPDGKILASGSADNTVKLWSVEPSKTPILLKTFRGHGAQIYGVAFSPDGQTIASASADNTVKLWKPDGTLLKTLTGHSALVASVAFSPDGQTIASASWDKTVKLWKRDGTLLTTLNGYSGRFWQVAFSSDGQSIASANEDERVMLWNKERVLTLNPLVYGCDWVHDYLKTNPTVSSGDRHLCDK